MSGLEGAIRQAFPDLLDGLISAHLSPMGPIGRTRPLPLDVTDIEAGHKMAAAISEGAFIAAAAALKGSSLEVTGSVAIGLGRMVGDLCRGAFRLAESGDLYSGKVVQRAMLEHHLRLLYLHERYWAEGTDSVGRLYATASDAEQDLNYAKTLASMERIFGFSDGETPKSAETILKQQSTSYAGQSLSEIKKSARVFGHRAMIEYLVKGIRRRSDTNSLKAYDNPELLAGYLVQYHQLSSFVHGGSYAVKDREMWNRDQRLVSRKLKLLAFSVFQTDLISRCIAASLLSAVLPGMEHLIATMNEKTAHITYSNLLRWDGSMAFLE